LQRCTEFYDVWALKSGSGHHWRSIRDPCRQRTQIVWTRPPKQDSSMPEGSKSWNIAMTEPYATHLFMTNHVSREIRGSDARRPHISIWDTFDRHR
jgi:hypothetical protein